MVSLDLHFQETPYHEQRHALPILSKKNLGLTLASFFCEGGSDKTVVNLEKSLLADEDLLKSQTSSVTGAEHLTRSPSTPKSARHTYGGFFARDCAPKLESIFLLIL